MASYTVPAGHVGVYEKTLAADVVDTVTFALGDPGVPGWNAMPPQVEVITDGGADIYVTLDGATPTVAGTNCRLVPALAGVTAFDVVRPDRTVPVVVKLISAGTPVYSVGGA